MMARIKVKESTYLNPGNVCLGVSRLKFSSSFFFFSLAIHPSSDSYDISFVHLA